MCFVLLQAVALASPRHIIPFEYKSGFIIVDVVIDGRLPVKFLFDTGSRLSVLTDNSLLAFLGRTPDDRIRIVGSDRTQLIEGRLLRRTSFEVGSLSMKSQSLVVLDEDLLNLKELTGQNVYGILGVEAFGAYAVTIDYVAERIILEKSARLRKAKKVIELPIELHESRAFLRVFTKVHENYADTLQLLIDSGASLDLMLSTSFSDTLMLPPQLVPGVIATGLGGKVLGVVGRSDSIQLGPHKLQQLITHFQLVGDDAPYGSDNLDRDGLIGNNLLHRFVVTIDYPRSVLLLKPRRKFRAITRFDRSGMQLIRGGPDLDKIIVQRVTPKSPADLAGIQAGDVITRVGVLATSLRGLEGTRRALQGRINKSIKVHWSRQGKPLQASLTLQKLI